jgi:hypothetical protein
MEIWNYHPVTLELLGSSMADPDPMSPGEWLIPAHATPSPPGPPLEAGHVYGFNGASWEVVRDCRGQIWWRADAEPVLIDFIGDPVDLELTDVAPPAPPAPPITISARQIRLGMTRLNLRVRFESYVATADQDMRDTWQYGTEFRRDDQIIAEGLGHLDADALFELAKTL